MVARALVQTVQAGASLAACYLFASLYPDIRRVRADKSTGKMPLLPLTSMFGNCVLWCLYGFLARDFFPLVATNLVGVGFSTFYIAVYYQFTPQKSVVQHHLLATCAALSLVALYPAFSYEPRVIVQQHVGYIAIFVCAVMFGSPLVLVKQVIATKNADVLPFSMIFAGIINSLLWLTYGFILDDLIVILPNILNLVLGGIQVALLCVYPQTKRFDKMDAKHKKQENDESAIELTVSSSGTVNSDDEIS